jgi:hypothetical protein
MEDKLSIHVRAFNEKVRIMNQTQKRDLLLSAQDARNLHADIFALLSQIAELQNQPQPEPIGKQILIDGGGFK